MSDTTLTQIEDLNGLLAQARDRITELAGERDRLADELAASRAARDHWIHAHNERVNEVHDLRMANLSLQSSLHAAHRLLDA